MAIIKPFKALRPTQEKVEVFSCPPYDVLEDNEVREIASKKPESYVRVTRAEVDFSKDVDVHSEEVYKKGAENLKDYLDRGIIIQDSEEAFYIYRETWRGKSQTGFYAVASVDEYDEGKIKKHELTREDKEDDRTKHIMILEAQAEPVFLTFKAQPKVKEMLQNFINKYEKLYDLTDETEVRHEMWKVDQKDDVELLKSSFEKINAMYIADGHHRSAAASRTKKISKEKNPNHTGDESYNYFLAAIFPHDELRVLDYNRIVKDLNNMNEEEFISKLKDIFDISDAEESPYSPKNLHEVGMYLNKKWYKLQIKEKHIDRNDPVKELDVYILQNYVLDPILGIENPRKDSRIHFLGGIRGVQVLEDWVDNKGYTVAFSMFPTPLEQLINVSDADKIMPPKSTWFEPKLKSGLVIHKI
jgi:uncharacterized protein (DUF1015 family)